MLVAEYKRDMHNNYMVIKDKDNSDNYGIKMLLNNAIPGLLKVELRVVDNMNLYYYDITAKQPIILLFEKGQLKKEQISKIILGIIKGMEKAREFLLIENNFVLDPQYLFISLSSFEVVLCYVVGYNQDIRLQLCHLIEFLMNKVDHTDQEAVLSIYALYKCSREENCTIYRFLDVLEQRKKSNDKSLELTCTKKGEETADSGFLGEEMIEEEEEVCYYSKETIASGIVSVLTVMVFLGFLLKIGGLHRERVLAVSLLIIIIECYYIYRTFSKKNKKVSVQAKVHFIEPKSYNTRQENEQNQISQDKEETHDYNVDARISKEEKTSLLGGMPLQKAYKLSPENGSIYEEILLTEFPFFIGKLKTSVDYTIENNLVSRFHAKIEQDNSGIYIWDLNSTNGTYVNNIRIENNERLCLSIGDVITFANVKYRFTYS